MLKYKALYQKPFKLYKKPYQSVYKAKSRTSVSMDFFSHLLWTYLPFRKKEWCAMALFFGVLPDIGYLLIMFYREFCVVNINMDFVPGPFLALYHILHSFIALAFVALVLYVYRPAWLPAYSSL